MSLFNLQQTQDQVIHHAANFAAITIPVVSFSLNGPEAFTYITSILGIIWYLILITERVVSWFKQKKT
jgi:hypothetical protein